MVALPADYSANEILTAYFEEEKQKYRLGSPEADLFLDAVVGCKSYFEKCVGRVLLYTFERQQYKEFRKLWEEGRGWWAGRNAGDVYGAEHLCRLLVSLPELMAGTNMDHESISKTLGEMAKLAKWLGKNANRFFTTEYEKATPQYVAKDVEGRGEESEGSD